MANPGDDELTALPDRKAFLGVLRRQVVFANDKKNILALIVLDLDGFSRINATHGFEFGDRVLQHLAVQLREVARSHDYVGRLGGDRFALLLPRVMNSGHAELAVQKLQRLLDVPFQHGDHQARLAATVGVALCPQHATHPDYLLRLAEKALALARDAGVNCAVAPDGGPSLDLTETWDIEIELDGALQRGELALHYQPQVRVSDLRPVGVEALMRWTSRSRGVVSPDVFIPIAERTGLIKKLTIWALNTALRQAAQWQHPWDEFTVAVNLPASLVAQYDLPDLVENAMHLWGRAGVGLVLEITERSLMDARHSFDILSRLRALGARVSIDDFGTGYSCLAYFKDIPADELKVDRSFVAGLLDDTASVHVSTLVIDLAHRFGLAVVAEGIENAATLSALRGLGCDTAQGWLFGKAMSSDDMQLWLNGAAAAHAIHPA
jgi:diguanylate cyclase (GGDEF)-like protein